MSETRSKISYRFDATGDEKGPVLLFSLRRETQHQIADKRVSGGWRDESRQSTVIAENITRRDLVHIIEDAADWLSYTGD